MTNYVLPTNQSDCEATTNIDFAFVRIDDHAKERLAHFKKVRDGSDALLCEGAHTELVLFSYWASYYGFYSDPVSDDYDEESSFEGKLEKALEGKEVIEATDEELSNLGLERQRTELDEIHICYDGIYWTCTPKYHETTITTAQLNWERLGIE